MLTDSQWKDCIRGHLDYITGKNVESVIFLVTQNYVIEYTIWNSIQEKEESDNNTANTHVNPQRGPVDVINDYLVELGKVLVNKKLKSGHLLSPNSGIRFE